MVAKDCHIGDKMNVGVDFPCPKCGEGKATGSINKAGKIENGIVDITANCDKCGEVYNGTASLHEAGMDVDVQFPKVDVKDSQLNVYGF